MSDRFDFLEIDAGRRSQVRRLQPEQVGQALPGRSRPGAGETGVSSPSTGGVPWTAGPPLVWRVVETIGEPGSGAGRFRAPAGIAVDRSGSLYVTDPLNECVQRIAPDGGVAVLDVAGGAPPAPVAVAVDEDLTFYILGRRESGVLSAFAADGSLQWRWRASGFPSGAAVMEGFLACDRGAVVLLDAGSARIVRIRGAGAGRPPAVIEAICHPGLTRPRAVCVDRGGRLIVGDAGRQEILVLERETAGSWKLAWRCLLPGTDAVVGPSAGGLAADPRGLLFAVLPGSAFAVMAPGDRRLQQLELRGLHGDLPSGSLALGPDGSLYLASLSGRIYRLKPAA